jgi:hypothetical protein
MIMVYMIDSVKYSFCMDENLITYSNVHNYMTCEYLASSTMPVNLIEIPIVRCNCRLTRGNCPKQRMRYTITALCWRIK